MLGKSISRNSLILALFAIVTAGLLASIYTATKARIAEQQKIAAEKALLEIVPRDRHDNSMLDSLWQIPEVLQLELGLDTNSYAHIAELNGKPVAVIIPATAPDGYSGDIDMLIGINVDGSVAGVRIIGHKETPGLGDQIDLNKSDWTLSFDGKSLKNPEPNSWTVKKDGGAFDQFTGATITPRAVVNRVKETLVLFSNNQQAIFTDASAPTDEKEHSNE